jgi:hypothetical protein
MATTLDLNTIELTTSISTAPLNGPPSSAEYNETQRDLLADLSSISIFINTDLIPLLNSLLSISLSPTQIGIQGSTIISDTTDTTDVFYDSVEGQSLCVADSLRVLAALIAGLTQDFGDIDLQIAQLQSTLANSNQNNVSVTIAGLQATVNNLTSLVSSEVNEVNSLSSSIGTFNVGGASTGSIPALSTLQVTVNLSTPYADNNYSPSLSLEDPSGQLQIISFTYQAAGVGVLVLVRNNDAGAAHMGTIHILTKHV